MDKLLQQEETRQRLGGIGRTKLWELDRSGQLRGVNIGRRRLYPESEVQALIARLCDQDNTVTT